MARTTKKARRGRGEASIYQRESDGKWVGSLSLGYDTNGKRRRKVVYADSKGEVAEELRKLQADHDAGRLVETEELTTGQFLTRWLNNTAKERVRPATWERYRQLVELYLVPFLGRIMLAKLRPMHVEQCYAEMARGIGERKPAGAHTRKFAGVVLSIALRHAVRMRLIPSNPAVDVAKARPAEREMLFMTASQAKWFLEAARSNQNYALFALALGSGARQGELLALTWADLDFSAGVMNVRRSLSRVGKEFVVKEPKSRSSRRTISLPAFALAALQAHRNAALKGGRIAGPVFGTRTGNYLDKKNVLRAFRIIVAKANNGAREAAAKTNAEPDLIPDAIRFHDLRHSHATALIAAGHSIKAVSRRLGHADVTITLRVYAHLMPDDDAKLASGVGLQFG
jgi:integrase